MKYFGEPNSFVIDYDKLKHVFQFDENGEFETNDRTLIEWMRKNKNFIPCRETEPEKTEEPDKTEEAGEPEAAEEPEKPKEPKKRKRK
jgi:hypothetical protein